MKHTRDEKSIGCLKHECIKGKRNNYMPNKNEREIES
jgi:hypothetical protein